MHHPRFFHAAACLLCLQYVSASKGGFIGWRICCSMFRTGSNSAAAFVYDCTSPLTGESTPAPCNPSLPDRLQSGFRCRWQTALPCVPSNGGSGPVDEPSSATRWKHCCPFRGLPIHRCYLAVTVQRDQRSTRRRANANPSQGALAAQL